MTDHTFDYIRDHYGVPAAKGARIRHKGSGMGTITKARGQYFYAQMDRTRKVGGPFHPTSEMEYLDSEGAVIWSEVPAND